MTIKYNRTGAEAKYKEERKILLRNLTGNGAFKSGQPKRADDVGVGKSDGPEINMFLHGSRPLMPNDLDVHEHYASEGGCFTFCLDLLVDEAIVFGRRLSNEQMDSYIVIYAVYDGTVGQVNDTIDIELRWPHKEEWFHSKISPEVSKSVKQKMDEFYVGMYGGHLPEPPAHTTDEQ